MRICGIDASSTCTAISLFVDGQYKKYELINLKKMKDKNERLNTMMLKIGELLDDLQPDNVLIEDTWTSANPEISQMLSSIQGAVRYWCLLHDCTFNKIKPSMWRSQLGLNKDESGNKLHRDELKQKSIEFAEQAFGIKCETDDVADAVNVGLVCVRINGGNTNG